MSVFIGYPSFMAYQMMKGKKGNNDDFPSITGMIARYSASGLTNEQMAANPVWVDKTGNGHDLQLKNFAWKRMSGVGGYVTNKDIYEYDLDRYFYTFIENGTKVHDFYIVFELIGYDENFKDGFNLDVRSTSQGLKKRETYTKNGIYIFQYKDEEGLDNLYAIGYNGNGGARSNFTVKILPLYPGFILGDGVDDFAVTEKELNFEDTYTVYTAFIPFQDDPVREMTMCGKDFKKDFHLYYSNTHLVYYTSGLNGFIPVHINQLHIIVCKRDKTNAVIKNLITGESKTFSVSELIDNPGVYYLWRSPRSGTSTAKSAIAGQIICNGYYSTDEDDEKVLDWYKKQYPWLFFDQAWTVVGKTNEDEDRATIANITGNGNDLVLSNFGFIEGSGYNEEGEYAGYLVTDGVNDKILSSSFLFGNDFTVVGEWEFLQEDSNVLAGFNKNYTYFVLYNYISGVNVYVKNSKGTSIRNTKTLKAVTSEGLVYIDFNSEQKVEIADKVEADLPLYIAYNGNNYTKMAFKNLAIYPTVLSKDDCIKAYKYLQTLKAK